jgi:AmmeMemoRadiSam system protein A
MFSTPEKNPYLPHRPQLLQLARTSLAHGVETGRALPVSLYDLPDILRENRATFVTLEQNGQLRGCIGHLEASQPLAIDVSENAVAAALEDPRFSPVTKSEVDSIILSISILTPPEPLMVKSEADLLAQIRPGIDGLILQEGHHRATFLPSVWDDLPRVEDFISHLKRKAGWHPGYWSDHIKVSRYRAYNISEQQD